MKLGNLENEILWDFFLTTEQRLKHFGEKFGAFFRKKIRSSKKSFVQNSLCRRATLNLSVVSNRDLRP